MMFGPTLPMLLLALPVLASVIVVLAGFFSLFLRTSPHPQALPRAVAMPMSAPHVPRVATPPRARSYGDDEQTIVFHRPMR
jgi:hypothetical protein